MLELDSSTVLGPSPEFSLREEPAKASSGTGARVFFRARDGRRVETDALGATLWKSLPGKPAEIAEKAGAGTALPARLIQDFLILLVEAGIVREEGRPGAAPGRAETGSSQARPPARAAGPLVSVVIVTHRGERHIGECLESIKRQTYGPIETIVVDNASRDRTAEIVREVHPGARLVRTGRNLFYPGGVNCGLKKAKGDYFFVLNDDTALEPGCVAELVSAMDRAPDAGAVSPLMKFYDLRGFVNGLGNHVRHISWGSDNFIGAVDIGQFVLRAEVPSACFGAVLLRRRAVREVGLLDERYVSYYEDADWSYRCWMAGWRIVPAPRAVLYHKFGGSWSTTPGKLRLVVRNRLRFVLKLFEGRTRRDFLISYLKEDVKTFLGLVRRRKFGVLPAYPAAYLSLLAGLPGILEAARKIHKRNRNGLTAADILKKNEEIGTFLNERNEPVLHAAAYFGYYLWEFRKLRGTGP